MFRVFPEGFHFPFMNLRFPTAILSLIAMAGAIYFIATKGLNYGVDFAGGIQMVLQFAEDQEVSEGDLRAGLENIGITENSVQRFGGDFQEPAANEFMINFPADFANDEETQAQIERVLGGAGGGEPIVESFRFSGLEKAYFRLTQAMPLAEIRSKLEELDFGLVDLLDVNVFGSAEALEFEMSFSNVSEKVVAGLVEELGVEKEKVSIQKLDFVGAKVGSDLKTSALLSVLVTILLVFIYIFVRFDLVYAPGVVLALGHDVLITTGLFALFGFEFDLTVVAALLTVAGYSINDTIIVYDRIREVSITYKGKKFSEILDIAISQTLNRTVITSATTIAATVILWLYGGPVIHSFAFALSAGVIIGTYSSIFVASTLVLWVDKWQKSNAAGARKAKAA